MKYGRCLAQTVNFPLRGTKECGTKVAGTCLLKSSRGSCKDGEHSQPRDHRYDPGDGLGLGPNHNMRSVVKF